MATYKMVQPGLAQVTRDDGQSIILPLDEQSAQAQGLTPEAAPGGIPMPSMQNPASVASSPSALASNDSHFSGMPPDAGGAGVFAQPAAAPDPAVVRQQLLTPQPVSHESRPEPSKFDVKPTGETAEAGGLPAERKLLPTAAAPAVAQQQSGDEAERAAIIRAAMAEGRGGGPAKLGIVSETKKYHEQGQVDPALAADIQAQQAEVDQGASSALEDQALHKGDSLLREQTLQQEQARQVQEAMQRRQKIDNEIASLATKSQAAQDALSQAKPKAVDQFWKDASFSTKLASGIAIIFGGQAAVRGGGGPNQGLEAVNRMVDQWANDERQKYEVAKDKATLTNNAYKDALTTYGSPELAQANLLLQANAAKEALIKNQAEQIGTTDALGQAQLALQDSMLQRKKGMAQAQAQLGADVEARLTVQGGGSGGGVLAAIKRGAEAKKGLDDIYGTTNEDKKIAIEQGKSGAGKAKASQAAVDAADAVDRLRHQTAGLSGRTGEGAGEADAMRNDAEAKYAAALQAGGLSGKAAMAQARALFEGVGDKVRVTGAQDAKLKKAAQVMRANATRSIARGAIGQDEAAPEPEGEIGELE